MCKFNRRGTQWWNCLRVCIIIALFLCQTQILVNAASSTTCNSSSNCTLREWLVKLKEESYSFECTLAQLEKSTALLSKVNYSTTYMRLSQISKLKKTISNLKGEIEIISLTCSTFFGPDCNLTTPECNSKCITCDSGICSVCSGNWNGSECSVCKSGWNGTDCNVPICNAKCKSCASPGQCTTCYGNWNGTTCANCNTGWNGTLCNVPICESKCTNCTLPGSCSNCTGNWDGQTCSVCKSGWNGTDCNTPICGSNCASCSSPNVCQTCKLGWHGSDCNSSLILTSSQINKFTAIFMPTAQLKSSKLLFKASRDGFSSSAFHSKCDNKGPTIVIIKATTGAIFGGYTSVNWTSISNYVVDSSAFVFSLVSSNKEERFTKFTYHNSYAYKSTNVYVNQNAIYDHPVVGPTFGSPHDIYISSDANANTNSFSQLCFTYCDTVMTSNTDPAKTYLAGTYTFQVEDYEVFSM